MQSNSADNVVNFKKPLARYHAMKTLAIILGVLCVLCVVFYFSFMPLVLSYGSEKIKTFMQNRGFEISWSKIDGAMPSFDGELGISFQDLNVTGRGLTFKASEMTALTSFKKLLKGHYEVDDLEIAKAKLRADISALKKGSEKQEESTTSSKKFSLGSTSIEQLELEVLNGELELGAGTFTEISCSELVEPIVCKAKTENLSGLDAHFTGKVDLELTVHSLLNKKAEFIVQADEPFLVQKDQYRVKASGAKAEIDPSWIQASVEQVEFNLGKAQGNFEKIEVEQADHIRSIQITGGEVTVDGIAHEKPLIDQFLHEIPRVLDRAERDKIKLEPIVPPSIYNLPWNKVVQGLNLLKKGFGVVQKVSWNNIHVHALALDGEKESVFSTHGLLTPQEFEIGGTIGGKFEIFGNMLPDQPMPVSLNVNTTALDLDALGNALKHLGFIFGWPIKGLLFADISVAPGTGSKCLYEIGVSGDPTACDVPDFVPIEIEGKIEVAGGEVDWPSVSREPLTHLDGQLNFNFVLSPIFSGGTATILSGPYDLALTGMMKEGSMGPEFKGTMRLEPLTCQQALDGLPRELLGPYKKIEVEGNLDLAASITIPFQAPKKTEVDLKKFNYDECVVTALNAERSAWPDIKIPNLELTGLARKQMMNDVFWLMEDFIMRPREGVDEDVEVFIGPGTKDYVSIKDVSTYMVGATYLSEEMNFYNGAGISKMLITRAVKLNLEGRRYVYGGSTITQQLVKNLFLTRDKTLARKFREALIASRVASAIPKSRILELYLNCIEFGPNIYGIGPAAEFYYQKKPSDLRPMESIILAMYKPSPFAGPLMKKKGVSPSYPYWINRIDVMLDRMVEYGHLDPALAEAERPHKLLYWHDGVYDSSLPYDVNLLSPKKDDEEEERGE